MLKQENKYNFRKRLLTVHEKDIRDSTKTPLPNDLVLLNGTKLAIPKDAGKVLLTAAKDFIDYLFTSLGVTAELSYSKTSNISFELLPYNDLSNAKRMEYTINIDENIKISGYNERGLAQALYRLELIMSERRAPYLKKEKIHSAPLFSPRMVHSAYGLDMYPNEYLSQLAHKGIDAILLCVKGVDKVPSGYLDFNELCYRASKYGIDIYVYSYLKSTMHPDNAEAENFYDKLYGSIFKNCPLLAGVVMVGESMGFPSQDPDTNGQIEMNNNSYEIPSSKPFPGWWPCRDYPKLVDKICTSIRKHSPDADIVFWTYNWGYAPEKNRIELINSLPKDISLLVTFEMFEKYSLKHTQGYCADYTLSFTGPGKYYLSEAKAAKKNGIRLYAMSNTAGKTWDFGSVPYLPMPYQWINRYKELIKSHYEHGLCGLMESHTFGLYPSFISELANLVYSNSETNSDILLSEVLSRNFGAENIDVLKKAFNLWSDAITYYIPSNEDQYGAFRIGPAYPFCFTKKFLPKAEDNVMFGADIVIPDYEFPYLDFSPPPSLRTDDEIISLIKMSELIFEGIKLIKILDNSNNQALANLLNLGQYIYVTVKTGINAKKWYLLKTEIRHEKNKEKVLLLLKNAQKLLIEEIENAKDAIPLVKADSSLGFEPSMGYLGDAEHIEWKIKQVEYVLNVELKEYEKRIFTS